MRQFWQMFLFDVKRNMKNFMGAYMLIVPVIILIILQNFLPTVANAAFSFAVVTEGENKVPDSIIRQLEEFAEVLPYESVEKMEAKLRGPGSIEGLYWSPEENKYISVMERSRENNKVFSVAGRVIRQDYLKTHYPDAEKVTVFSSSVPEELKDRTEKSPVATMGGAIFLVFMVIITAFIIGLGIVNDKEEGTNRAIRVSPVTKAEYFLGKSIQPLLIIAIYTIIAIIVLDLIGVDLLKVYTVVGASFSVSLLFGLVLGALGRNETEAIGVGKLLSMVGMLAILGGTLLPDMWQFIVWWSPFYWLYDVLEEIFTDTASWFVVGWKCGVVIGLSGIYFMLLRKKMLKGLA